MGKNTKNEITPYGGRIKTEAEERGYTRERMAELLCYSDVTQISRINSCKTKVTDDRFKILAKEWGLREEYLRCIDDWKTELDKQLDILAEKSCLYEAQKQYLASIDLEIKPAFFWITNWKSIFYSYESMYPYIASESIEHINKVIDFSKQEDEVEFDCEKEVLIELIDNPFPDMLRQLSEIDEEGEDIANQKENSQLGFELHPQSKNRPNGKIEIRNKVYYKCQFIGIFDMEMMHLFSNTIDKVCIASIESILLSRVLCSTSYTN